MSKMVALLTAAILLVFVGTYVVSEARVEPEPGTEEVQKPDHGNDGREQEFDRDRCIRLCG